MYADKEKEKTTTRERVRRFRQNQKVTPVTASGVASPAGNVTPLDKDVTPNKMVCKCAYFKIVNNQLVCVQCGRPAPPKKGEDKIRRGIETK